MATIFGSQIADEWWLPARYEAVTRRQRAQAREQRIHNPQLAADPGHLMAMDVAREMRAAREEACLIPSGRFHLLGDARHFIEQPDLSLRPDGKGTFASSNTHRALELMEGQR